MGSHVSPFLRTLIGDTFCFALLYIRLPYHIEISNIPPGKPSLISCPLSLTLYFVFFFGEKASVLGLQACTTMPTFSPCWIRCQLLSPSQCFTTQPLEINMVWFSLSLVFDQLDVVSYEEVVRLPAFKRKTLVLIGIFSQLANSKAQFCPYFHSCVMCPPFFRKGSEEEMKCGLLDTSYLIQCSYKVSGSYK